MIKDKPKTIEDIMGLASEDIIDAVVSDEEPKVETNEEDVITPTNSGEVIELAETIALKLGLPSLEAAGISSDCVEGGFQVNTLKLFKLSSNEEDMKHFHKILATIAKRMTSDISTFGGYGESASEVIRQLYTRAIMTGYFDKEFPILTDPDFKQAAVTYFYSITGVVENKKKGMKECNDLLDSIFHFLGEHMAKAVECSRILNNIANKREVSKEDIITLGGHLITLTSSLFASCNLAVDSKEKSANFLEMVLKRVPSVSEIRAKPDNVKANAATVYKEFIDSFTDFKITEPHNVVLLSQLKEALNEAQVASHRYVTKTSDKDAVQSALMDYMRRHPDGPSGDFLEFLQNLKTNLEKGNGKDEDDEDEDEDDDDDGEEEP